MRMRWFFAFFFFSGFCSLLYEVIWVRLGMAHFGVTTPVISIFLSLFMGGLGLGSWLAGRWMGNLARGTAVSPLRLYALAELLIGLSAWAVPLEMRLGRRLLENYGSDLSSSSLHYYAIAGLWITAILLPWTTCMGATFPLAMAAIRNLNSDSQRSFSFLYLANVLGAVAGSLLPAFVLIEIFGFRNTMKLAAICNLLISVTALVLDLRWRGIQERPQIEAESSRPAPLSSGKLILGLLFLTGLLSLAMEVVWIRQFTPFVGTEVYAFASILASYLLGTFIGSRIYRKWLQRHSPSDDTVAWLLLGLAALLPLLACDPRLPIIGFLRVPLGIMPISGLMGFLTPMLVDRYSEGDPNRAGRAYAVNVVGCILGPLFAGFLLLPHVGERQALILLCMPLFVLLYIFRPKTSFVKARYGLRFYIESAVVALVLIVFTKDYAAYIIKLDYEVHRDYAATIWATGQGMDKLLFVNGVTITNLTPITKMMAHLPLALHEQPPKDVLVICFGMGTTHRSMLSWGVSSSAVELLPSVPQVFSYFHPDGDQLLRSPKSHLIIDDGRLFLEKTYQQFDVITIDPPPPTSAAGVSLLYSKQFYEIAKRRLRPGGILQQWTAVANEPWSVPTDPRVSLVAIAKALKASFPYVRCIVSGKGFHFLASMSPIPNLTPTQLADRMPPAAVTDMLEWGPGHTAEEQFALELGSEIPIDQLLQLNTPVDVQALDDDRPVNEYYLLRAELPTTWSKALYGMVTKR